jgi:hypothetical protein
MVSDSHQLVQGECSGEGGAGKAQSAALDKIVRQYAETMADDVAGIHWPNR